MIKSKYLIDLSGQGDQYYMVVGDAAWEWLNSKPPLFKKNKSSVMERIPDEVINEGTSVQTRRKNIEVTIGSWKNDRALQLMNYYTVEEKRPNGPFRNSYGGYVY